MTYRSAAQGWHDYFIVAGTAAATLVGLLFVGLSLHLRAVISRPDVRSLARVTLANFGLVLVVSLFMVVPQPGDAVGLQLVVSGVISFLLIARSVTAATRSGTRTLGLRHTLLRFGFSGLGYAGVIVAGALMSARTYDSGFATLLSVTIALLVVSLRNSWDLLVTVGEATMGAPSRDPR